MNEDELTRQLIGALADRTVMGISDVFETRAQHHLKFSKFPGFMLVDAKSKERLLFEIALLQGESSPKEMALRQTLPPEIRHMNSIACRVSADGGVSSLALFDMKMLVAERDKIPWNAVDRNLLADPLNLLPKRPKRSDLPLGL